MTPDEVAAALAAESQLREMVVQKPSETTVLVWRADLLALLATYKLADAGLASLDVALAREERDHLRTIDQRDAAQDWADRLAYAIAPLDVIGEHSNMNDPWHNALDHLDDAAKLADEGLAGKTLDAEHEPWCYRRHAGDCVDGQAAAPATAPSSTLREKARLVAQWHGAIGSGPLEVLDAELADLAAAVRAEPDTLGVDRLARAILVAAQESDRRPITDGFEWYGSALELAEGVRDALAALDAG